MKIKQIMRFSTVFLFVLFLSACATDYRAAAVEEAREYALKHMQGLSVLQQNYIRYNNPVIMTKTLQENIVPSFVPDAHIVTRHERHVYTDPARDMMIQCMVWEVPGMDGALTVAGTGQRDYRYWSPDRIVIRTEQEADLTGDIIQKKAMIFAMNTFPELSGKIRLRVRFSTPEVYTSLFIIEDQDPKNDAVEWMDFLKKAAANEPRQISAVWSDPDTGERIVVAGYSGNDSLKTWIPRKAYKLSEKDAKIYLGLKYSINNAGKQELPVKTMETKKKVLSEE